MSSSATPLPDQGIVPAGERISFKFEDVSPPGPLYIGPDDVMLLTGFASVAGVTVVASLRLLGPDGTIRPFRMQVSPDATRGGKQSFVKLRTGFLISASIFAANAPAVRGQAFGQLLLVRGGPGTSDINASLVAGYVTTLTILGWPYGTIADSTAGRGAIRSIVGTIPAAGVEITETVPTAALWRLNLFRFGFTTAVAVANRIVRLVIDDGVNPLAFIEGPAVQTAGLGFDFNYGVGFPSRAAVGAEHLLPLPSWLYLNAGWRIRTSTVALQAADNFSSVTYEVEEWFQF